MGKMDEQGRRILSDAPLDSLRSTICDRMTDSIVHYPQGTGSAFLDIGRLMAFRERLKADGHRVTFGDLYVKAAACAILENRNVNAALIDGNNVMYESINIGMMTYFNNILLEVVMTDVDQRMSLKSRRNFRKYTAI